MQAMAYLGRSYANAKCVRQKLDAPAKSALEKVANVPGAGPPAY